jgi:hypothetical protein
MVRTDGYACSLCYMRDGADPQQQGRKKKVTEKSSAAAEAPEFPRLDAMDKEQCDTILRSNPFAILAADPGVNNPATICDQRGCILKYTNKRRQDENCNRPHQRWLQAEKRKEAIGCAPDPPRRGSGGRIGGRILSRAFQMSPKN